MRVDAGPARAARRQGRLDGRQRGPAAGRQHLRHRGRRGAGQPDPRLLPGRRTAARPLRRGEDAAARAATRSAGGASTPTSTPSATWGPRSDGDVWIELSAPQGGPEAATRIFMDEPSVMGTENALLAAALTEGPTTIANAACEPHVQDLARLLCKMGAQIDGIGSNVMTVTGAEEARRRGARTSVPTTSRSPASWRWPPPPAASCASAGSSPRTWRGSAATSAASACRRWSRAGT